MRTYGRSFVGSVRSWDLCSSETGDDPVVHERGVACPIPAEEEQFVRRTIQRHFGREAARGILLSLKEGLTNDSFLFSACGKKYIFRRNGKGTEHLIDRENELRVYEALRSTGITGVQIGGERGWYMMGQVFFSRAFSEVFRPMFKVAYETDATVRTMLWEQFYMRRLDVLALYRKSYPHGVIHEFDTLADILAFDAAFAPPV